MDPFDDVDTTGNPYEPGPASPSRDAELRTWTNEALHEAWENRESPLANPKSTDAVGREITRRDNATQWRDYGTAHGLTPDDADRFAEFVDSWDGENLADALTAYRDQA